MNKQKILVTCASGIEAVTKRELAEMGIDAKAINGRIEFDGDFQKVAELNVNLRTADRVLIKISEFEANTFDMLYDNILDSEIGSYLSPNARIIIKAKSTKSMLHSNPSIQSVSKKAIIENMKKYHRIECNREDGEDYLIDIAIFNDIATIAINTSGIGLHKRGYRDMVWKAPLKETIAAAMIKLSVWNAQKPLIDPFCGSGTIPIEAGLIAQNIASGLFREFQFEKYDFFPKECIKLEKERAEDLIIRKKNHNILGSDITEKAIILASHHAERAGLEIDFACKDMREITSSESYGIIITNPPYGERLLDENEIKILYNDMYRMYKKLDNWSMYVLSGNDNLPKYFGKKPMKNRKLYNGNIECKYYSYLGERPPKLNTN